MLKVIATSAILAVSSFSVALAEDNHNDKSGVYATIGGTILSTELDLTDANIDGQSLDLGTEDTTVAIINGRVGYRFNDFFAVEGELGFGLGGDEVERTIPVDVLGTTVNADVTADLSVDNYFIGFARGIYPVSDQFDVFLRLGYGQASGEADAVGTALGFTAAGSFEDDVDGFAYGVGAQYNITNHDGIRADYTRLESTDIISLAYSRRF